MENLKGIWDIIVEKAPIYGIKIAGALAIFVLGRIIVAIIRSLTVKIMKKSNVDDTLIGFTSSLGYFALMTIVIIASLGQLGVQTTSFVAIVGAAGLAIGLALQGSLANFASGVLLIIFKPIKVGDYVEAAGITGVVEDINIFTTEFASPDNKKIIVPNAKLTGDNITNYSTKGTRRVDMTFGISYDDDILKAKEILKKVIAEDARVLPEPALVVGVMEHADSSINIVCRPWVNVTDYWSVWFDTHEKVKLAFDDADITIPFPQQDIHLHKVDA